jgi:N-acetylneuraminic acid mutarotase
MRNGVALWTTLLFLGVALVVVVASSRDQVFGEGGKWTLKAPMLTPRSFHAVGVVNKILYAVGGATLTGSGYLNTVEAYDPSTNTWMVKASMPTHRMGHAVGVVDGILYAVGGSSAPLGGRILATVEAYDPSTNRWKVKASMPTHRTGHAVGVVNGILYAVGGMGSPGGEFSVPLSTVEAYDPTRNMWTTRTPMPSPSAPSGTLPGWERGRISAVGVVNGILYAVGGVCCAPGHNVTILNTVEAYNPIADTWTAKAPMPTPWDGPVGVVNGILYAVGGVGKGSVIISTVEAYSPTTNMWMAKAPMPSARYGHAVGIVNGILYAVGGNSIVGSGSAFQVVRDGRNYAFEVAP